MLLRRLSCLLRGGHHWGKSVRLEGQWYPFLDSFIPLVGMEVSFCRRCLRVRIRDLPPLQLSVEECERQHRQFWERFGERAAAMQERPN